MISSHVAQDLWQHSFRPLAGWITRNVRCVVGLGIARSLRLTVRDKTAAVCIVCAQSALLLWPRLPSPRAKTVASISPVRAVADRRPVSRSQSASEGVKNLERWLTRDSQGITKLLMKVMGQLRYNRMTSAVPGFCDVESVMCCGGGFAGTSSVRHIVYHTMVTTAHRCRAS